MLKMSLVKRLVERNRGLEVSEMWIGDYSIFSEANEQNRGLAPRKYDRRRSEMGGH